MGGRWRKAKVERSRKTSMAKQMAWTKRQHSNKTFQKQKIVSATKKERLESLKDTSREMAGTGVSFGWKPRPLFLFSFP